MDVSSLKILVVDDEALVLKLTVRILAKLGLDDVVLFLIHVESIIHRHLELQQDAGEGCSELMRDRGDEVAPHAGEFEPSSDRAHDDE